jgi:IMP dehydrogenase
MEHLELALTFDDVLLLPAYSEVMPQNVDLHTRLTRNLQLNIPFVSAAMDTVTEAPLAIAMAQAGGIGIMHMCMTPEDQAQQIRAVKTYESGIVSEPRTLSPNETIGQVVAITKELQYSGLPVVEGDKLVGIITNRDIRFVTDMNAKVAEHMTPKEKLITIKEGGTREEALALFQKYRIEKLLVVNDAFELRGLMTVKDILKAKEYPHACKDHLGRLRVGAAISTGESNYARADALVKAGVDVLVVDTAHGFSSGVIAMVKYIKQAYPQIELIAGNVATADGAIALAKAGADGVKVGMGPGSICTTRIIAGIGVPQFSAIYNVAKAMKKFSVPVIADGGIRFSGDACKAIAAGASTVMIGGLLAGTTEAPGEVILFQGRSYKAYRGMGSIGAMDKRHGSGDRYKQGDVKREASFVPEGIEGRVSYKGSVSVVLYQLVGGLRSGMGYTGAATIEAMRNDVKYIRITNAGMRESHVHDVVITKEAPNYSVEG